MSMNASLRILSMALLLLPACSVSQRVEKLSDDFREYYAKMPDYHQLPRRRISWRQALDKMLRDNLEYRELTRQLENARHRLGRTWRNLIPMLDAGYYYNAPLRWGKGYPAQSSININVIFDLPQLIQLPFERYMDTLSVIKAETDLRLKRRELEANLYQAFREQRLLARERALEQQRPGQDAAARRKARDVHEEKERQAWSKLCVLLNDYGARWEPDDAGLPSIRLDEYRRRAQAPDKLYLATLALQAEAARLQKLGTGIRFMPMANINFYSPSLFTYSGGHSEGFMRNTDDIRINLNSYISLDTRQEQFYDYKDAVAGEKMIIEAIHQNMREHREKILSVLKSWELYEEWKLSMRDYIAFRNRRGVSGFQEAESRHQESMELEKTFISQERANLERECGAIQEYGWLHEESEPRPAATGQNSVLSS